MALLLHLKVSTMTEVIGHDKENIKYLFITVFEIIRRVAELQNFNFNVLFDIARKHLDILD